MKFNKGDIVRSKKGNTDLMVLGFNAYGKMILSGEAKNGRLIRREIEEKNFDNYVLVDTYKIVGDVEEVEEKEFLLNVETKTITREGDKAGSRTYSTVIGKEIEVKGGFKFEGTEKETGRKVTAFLSTEDYFEGKEFREEAKASQKEIEVKAVIENTTVYNLDLPTGKRMKAVHDIGLKRGDSVTMEFADGERVTVQVERVGFMQRQTKDNKYIDRFYLEDCEGFCWNLYTAKTIRVDYRNPKSKKILTEDLKQFHSEMERLLGRMNSPKVTPVADKPDIKKALSGKNKPSNKEALQTFIESEGWSLGCWDSFIDKLSPANIKYLIDHITGDATDVIIRHKLRDYVISIDFVDGEADFTSRTKSEYINMFGSELFEY